jgi:hypothetical protein
MGFRGSLVRASREMPSAAFGSDRAKDSVIGDVCSSRSLPLRDTQAICSHVIRRSLEIDHSLQCTEGSANTEQIDVHRLIDSMSRTLPAARQSGLNGTVRNKDQTTVATLCLVLFVLDFWNHRPSPSFFLVEMTKCSVCLEWVCFMRRRLCMPISQATRIDRNCPSLWEPFLHTLTVSLTIAMGSVFGCTDRPAAGGGTVQSASAQLVDLVQFVAPAAWGRGCAKHRRRTLLSCVSFSST